MPRALGAVLVEGLGVSKDYQLLEESETLGNCGFNSQTAHPQSPATSRNPPTGNSGSGDHLELEGREHDEVDGDAAILEECH